MIDLLIPSQTSGERLVDHYGKAEILFFGPDGTRQILSENLTRFNYPLVEGTADMMDWAARMSSRSFSSIGY